jgi:flagellar biosynthesis protein FlhA
LREGVGIRDLPLILEALSDAGPRHLDATDRNAADWDAAVLAEAVRARLARQITRAACDSQARLPAVTLSADWDDRLTACLTGQGENRRLALNGAMEAELFAAIGKALDRQALAGERPVLLVTPELRRPLRRLLESSRPETAVLALREVDPKTAVRHLEEV